VSSVVDATTGIQAAMNSGNSTIYFPHGVYYISSPITIPATVQRIVGLDSTLHPIPYENWRTEGMFRILADASTPLTIEQLRFDNSNDGNQLALEQASNRTVVVRNVLFPGTLAVNRASSGGPLFMEDVSAAGSNVTLAGSATFEARQFDFENCGTCAYLSGVPSVLIGFKEEGNVTEESRQPHHCAGTKRHRHVDSDAPKQLGPVCIFCLQRWIDGAIVQLCAILAGVVLSLFFLSWRRRNALSKWMLLLAPIAFMPLLSGCGSGSNSPANPAPITHTVTLIATSGSLQHTSQLTVTLE
jgi:hypothetical protein